MAEQEGQHAQLASLTKLVMSTIVRYQFNTHLDFQLAPRHRFEGLMQAPLLAEQKRHRACLQILVMHPITSYTSYYSPKSSATASVSSQVIFEQIVFVSMVDLCQ